MATTYLEIVSVPVWDQPRAKRFYRDVLGFAVLRDEPFGPTERWIQLAPPGATTAVSLVTWFEQMPPGSLRGLVLGTADLDATWRALRDRGLALGPIQEARWGRHATFQDPDGNGWVVRQAGRPGVQGPTPHDAEESRRRAVAVPSPSPRPGRWPAAARPGDFGGPAFVDARRGAVPLFSDRVIEFRPANAPPAAAARTARPAPQTRRAVVAPGTAHLWQETRAESEENERHARVGCGLFAGLGAVTLGVVGYGLWQTWVLTGRSLEAAVSALLP